MFFSSKKGEFDRFFNRLDRPVKESRPDRPVDPTGAGRPDRFRPTRPVGRPDIALIWNTQHIQINMKN